MGRPLVYGVPKQVAEYLKLPNPDTYRSNCLRYTSMHIQSTENSGVKNLLIGKPIESLGKKFFFKIITMKSLR